MHFASSLSTKAITSRYDDNPGPYIYSEVQYGELNKAYTFCNEVVEKENVNLVEVFHTATSRKEFSLSQGEEYSEEDLEYGSEG